MALGRTGTRPCDLVVPDGIFGQWESAPGRRIFPCMDAHEANPTAPAKILGLRVDVETYATATERIIRWAQAGSSRVVCAANVHMVMEAYDSRAFQEIVNSADLITADGMPLVWTLRARGFAQAERVYGPDLMLEVCARASEAGVPIGFFGGTEALLNKLKEKLRAKYSGIKIVAALAPPFREISAAENESYAATLRDAGARVVFVALGCPKQEKWMAARRGSIPAVLIGVGAAFDFHAGQIPQAPNYLQRAGLEWAFRLAMEPRRLWKRYLTTNPRFAWLVWRETRFCKA